MNYQLIRNEQALQEFIDFLPELKANEGYFLILIARNKWNPDAKLPANVKLKRETVNRKDRIIPAIRQWEVEQGSYQYDGHPIPNDNLGVYIAYNPKDQYAACFQLINKCLDSIKEKRDNINIKSMANDVIQISTGSKNFIDIDVDVKEGEDERKIFDYIQSVIGHEYLAVVKTNGGFHCLVRLGDHLPRNWYKLIQSHPFKSDLNIMSNDLMPLVGCNQGKYIPNRVNLTEWIAVNPWN